MLNTEKKPGTLYVLNKYFLLHYLSVEHSKLPQTYCLKTHLLPHSQDSQQSLGRSSASLTKLQAVKMSARAAVLHKGLTRMELFPMLLTWLLAGISSSSVDGLKVSVYCCLLVWDCHRDLMSTASSFIKLHKPRRQ